MPSIDLKSFLYNILSYWKLFILTILVSVGIAKFKSNYTEKSYSISTLITVKEEHNPLFSSSTNIAFNWGGSSNIVETVKARFKTRTHNEKVVSKLKFYIDYLQEGKYRMEDVYGDVPFKIITDSTDYQIISTPIKLSFNDDNTVKVSINFEDLESSKSLMEYSTHTTKKVSPKDLLFEKTVNLNETINSPYFSFKIIPLEQSFSGEYFIRFNNFNSVVNKYKNVYIKNFKLGTSILNMSLTGSNKARLVKYLNTSVKVLGDDQKRTKIAYAVKTKNYIDTLFKREARNLNYIESTLEKFKDSNNIYSPSTEGSLIFSKIVDLDSQILMKEKSLEYVNSLIQYLDTQRNTENSIPVPSISYIEDITLISYITELTSLYALKDGLEKKGVASIHPEMINLTNQISIKDKIISENLNSYKNESLISLQELKDQLEKEKRKLKKIPKLEQKLIRYERNYKITEVNYNYLKQKSYEAGTAIAANVSDLKVLDKAKDIGQGSSKPNRTFNYLVAVILAIILPLFYIIIRQLLDDKIYSVEEIENLYKIPVLGVIGSNLSKSNLAVYEQPKSSVSESFRALRSNIQFLFKDNNKKNKTIVLTSSVSGEGKTMISINMATAFALSGKKTVLIGLDLRKPKIFNDFKLKNDEGVVNHLIGQRSIDEITHKTEIPNLDLILSGPIPPNPSELILNSKTEEMIHNLQEKYDYVIIDTPPVGLVSDALELFKYADANIYVIRQDYSKKGMMKMIDDKYINGEVKDIGYVLNDFSAKGKYGYSYGYGYGYGYGNYGNNYHENQEMTLLEKIKRIFKS